MWKLFRIMVLMSVSLSLWGCADSQPKEELKIERSGMIVRTAIVQAVDLKTRMVTLKGPDGNEFEIYAGKEVVNLPQVEIGDEVVVTYTEDLLVRMAKPGEVRDETSEGVARATPGNKPGAVEIHETTFTAVIVGMDRTLETATLRMPDGNLRIVKVQDPTNFDKVTLGDTIVVTITKAMAISVQKQK